LKHSLINIPAATSEKLFFFASVQHFNLNLTVYPLNCHIIILTTNLTTIVCQLCGWN